MSHTILTSSQETHWKCDIKVILKITKKETDTKTDGKRRNMKRHGSKWQKYVNTLKYFCMIFRCNISNILYNKN